MILFEKLQSFAATFENEFGYIAASRKKVLEALAQYILEKVAADQPVQLVVICTHNSRRSHIGQAWLGAGAAFYGIPKVLTFSGGTEATAFNHRSVVAMKRAGFSITTSDESENPVYDLSINHNLSAVSFFSKKYDAPENPNNNFAAIMVCTDADENCPIIHGADGRFSIPFEDPKAFDDTSLEAAKYTERVRQIGREMFYVMYFVQQNHNKK